ncbi:meiotic recombination protein DMC1 homolog B [Zea mays]|uniref:meiotic recombination protein DMC1 homolog B n=1 Tax=Zea mays TaxID=4577 RepID=UPI000C6C6E28|nr:meiotic recombination protein DMC1 homolog B-like [Zea mays]|eukprot:XP_023156195.1 meiotic recombination protein DMC1 homolog [Zea mays]
MTSVDSYKFCSIINKVESLHQLAIQRPREQIVDENAVGPYHLFGIISKVDGSGTNGTECISAGPGCSSFGIGAFQEIGPFRVDTDVHGSYPSLLLMGLAAIMAEEPFKLLVADTVIALFRVDFSGRGELAELQQKIAQMLSRLTKIAEEFNVAVYITNQVIADPGGGMFITDPKKPVGGHVLAHAAIIRLMLRKGKGKQCVCKIFDAPNLPEGEAIFQVTSGGIMDVKD